MQCNNYFIFDSTVGRVTDWQTDEMWTLTLNSKQYEFRSCPNTQGSDHFAILNLFFFIILFSWKSSCSFDVKYCHHKQSTLIFVKFTDHNLTPRLTILSSKQLIIATILFDNFFFLVFISVSWCELTESIVLAKVSNLLLNKALRS